MYCAKLDVIITADNFQVIENWMTMLFSTVGIRELEKNGSLRDFRAVMLASLLKDHEKMVKTYGYKNRLVRRMIDSAAIFGIDNPTLVQWSRRITDDWESHNATNFRKSQYSSHEEKQTIVIEQLEKKVASLEKSNKEKDIKLDCMDCKLDRLLELLENDGASPRKRRRGNDDEDGTIESAPVAAAAAAQGVATESTSCSALNAMSVLMASSKPDDPYSSDTHLRDTSLRQFLKTIVESRITWRSKGP